MLRILVSALIGIIFSLLSFSKAFSASEGLLFNALAAKRPATVPSREILLLEADEESIDAAGPLPWDNEVISEGLLILSEMRAGAVVFDFAIEKGTLIHTGMNDELRDSFAQEFSLIKNNIKTLFDAIRLGSVRPKDSAAFVDNILSLTDESKLRLMKAAGNMDPDRRRLKNIYHAGIPVDSSLHFIRPTFARLGLAEADDALGYAVLQAVLDRLGNPVFEVTQENILLRTETGIVIPLDKKGAILPELPGETPESSFRTVSVKFLLKHSRLEEELVNELKVMDQAGYLAWSGEGMSPVALYEFSKNPEGIDTEERRELRNRFFLITNSFLSGSAEKKIDEGYTALLESPTLAPEGKERLLALKSDVRLSFSRARQMLAELLAVREKLEKEIKSSICIIVPQLPGPASRVKAAAGLADAVLSAHFFRIFPSLEAFLLSALLAVLVSLILAALSPAASLFAGAVAVIFSASAASLFFVYSGIWFNPFLVAGSAAAAALVSVFISFFTAVRQKKAVFREINSSSSSGSAESPAQLMTMQIPLEPALFEEEKNDACIIAVRLRLHDSSDREKIVTALHIYHETIGAVLKEQGAFLYALEAEIIFASFPSPLSPKEQLIKAQLAAAAVMDAESKLAENFGSAGLLCDECAISIGIDAGPSVFPGNVITGQSGYAPSGAVPARAKILSGLGERYNCKILITEDAGREIRDGFKAVKLDKLVPVIDKSEKYFFCLSCLE